MGWSRCVVDILNDGYQMIGLWSLPIEGRTVKEVDDIFDGTIIRSIVAFERVEVGTNLLTISSEACGDVDDNQLYNSRPFWLPADIDQEQCLALRSPVNTVF